MSHIAEGQENKEGESSSADAGSRGTKRKLDDDGEEAAPQ